MVNQLIILVTISWLAVGFIIVILCLALVILTGDEVISSSLGLLKPTDTLINHKFINQYSSLTLDELAIVYHKSPPPIIEYQLIIINY